MKARLSFSDLINVGQPQIDEMRLISERAANFEDSPSNSALLKQLRLVEGTIVQAYRVAAALAKQAGDDLVEVAEVWDVMSRFCQSALQAMADLKDKHPPSATAEVYDLILDYKLASEKRYRGTLEEIKCLKTEYPRGIFPELS